MGLIDMIKPLSTVLRSAINKFQQHQEKNSWECRESNPGPLGGKRVCYLLCSAAPHIDTFFWLKLNKLPQKPESFFAFTIQCNDDSSFLIRAKKSDHENDYFDAVARSSRNHRDIINLTRPCIQVKQDGFSSIFAKIGSWGQFENNWTMFTG